MTNKQLDTATIQFRRADYDDAGAIEQLVNSGYRGDASRQGWTTEADLLGGTRIELSEVQALILHPQSVILLGVQAQEVVACVLLQNEKNSSYLGMFVVRPTLQSQGIGRQLMQAAEQYVQANWHSERIWMTVITRRTELIAYYVRRGYTQTGVFKPFPAEVADAFGKVSDLQFEVLDKQLKT
ncbi:MAG: GNAT family N-acetyltransferase [Burkholderiaceae bacterium]|nr:GNAT family N-acetyltransferase [Burkholderiaceae bacterium]